MWTTARLLEPFRDVTWNRYCRPTDLIPKTIIPAKFTRIRNLVNIYSKVLCPLPDLQLLKITHVPSGSGMWFEVRGIRGKRTVQGVRYKGRGSRCKVWVHGFGFDSVYCKPCAACLSLCPLHFLTHGFSLNAQVIENRFFFPCNRLPAALLLAQIRRLTINYLISRLWQKRKL